MAFRKFNVAFALPTLAKPSRQKSQRQWQLVLLALAPWHAQEAKASKSRCRYCLRFQDNVSPM